MESEVEVLKQLEKLMGVLETEITDSETCVKEVKYTISHGGLKKQETESPSQIIPDQLDLEEYKTNNCLKTEVSSKDVATLVCAMVGPAFAKTTGAQIPIDGGNVRVI